MFDKIASAFSSFNPLEAITSFAGDRYFMKRDQEYNRGEARKQRKFATGEREAAQEFSAKQIQNQMDFQERMSSTQTQRASKDLEKAGLNRILALGQPAVAPPGAAAQSSGQTGAAASNKSSGSGSNAVANGIRAASAAQAIKTQEAQEKLLTAQTAKTSAETAKPSAFEPLWETLGSFTGDTGKEIKEAHDMAKKLFERSREDVSKWLRKKAKDGMTTIEINRGSQDNRDKAPFRKLQDQRRRKNK